MRKIKILAITATFFLVTGNISIEAHGSLEPQHIQIVFADEPNGSLMIHNQSSIDFLLFAGNLTGGNILGGIWANSSRNFDIRKIPSVHGSGTFTIRAVPFEVYQRKQGVLVNQDVLWTDSVNYNLFDSRHRSVLYIIHENPLAAPAPIDAAPNHAFFANEENGVLTIYNQSEYDLALFAGRVERGNLLGGIRANSSRNFDINKIAGLPGNGAFIARAVLAHTYMTKPLLNSDDVLYSNLVIYNLNDSVKTILEIPAVIDESMTTFIQLTNETSVVAQIRLNSPEGTVIAALSPFERRRVYLQPNFDGYIIYPIYIFTNVDGEFQEIIPGSRNDGIIFYINPNQRDTMVMMLFNSFVNNERISLLFE